MSDGGALINFGDISKPATVLIEKVSNAVGILYEPRRIRKKAEAEAAAEKIKAIASVELNDIQQRAIDRFVQQETRKQENIETITAQAAISLDENARVEELEEDWVAHFFKQCDTVSDKEMQSLWSRLLSGEATNPGTFSKRTVDFVASMDKEDARIFTAFCQYCWYLDDGIVPMIFELQNEIFTDNGIDFGSLRHLDSIGVISFSPTSGYKKIGFGQWVQALYFGSPVLIEFDGGEDNEMHVGKALLTQIGQELASICGAKKNNNFYEYVIAKWYGKGLIMSTPITPTS
ncbi:TPA: DUF2806 domain-containing protein [Aeromonas dhakensis]|uniref:DUF2806 domain-containing protein n=1 Tax=Aeromonas dhakensis TaxID=196024 RepID=UPI000E3D3747|nr:DUF2806 domain-containing protein [Aeromonas dhakensis]RFS25969.1 DUF2806 domain-containing protein [Aeromonas dhakensis]HDZ8897134.1 DUF2806 domain-containing protein [Aeromonas dhakensis]